MDMKVRNSRVESSLQVFFNSVQVVRKHALYVIELNSHGCVRKVRRNPKGSLHVIAVTGPHKGAGSAHVLLAEVGLAKHRPYARTREFSFRKRFRVLKHKEVKNLLPLLENILETRRQLTLFGRKCSDNHRWVQQSVRSRWCKFETGIRVSVSRSDAELHDVFSGADLEYRRAAYSIDFYKMLIAWWLRKYQRSHYSKKEAKIRPGILKAVDLYGRLTGPFLQRFVVTSEHDASLLSCVLGKPVEYGVPKFLPLRHICARYVRQRKVKGGKKKKGTSTTFEVLSGDAIRTMRYYKKNVSSVHRSEISPDELERYLRSRYEEKVSPPSWI